MSETTTRTPALPPARVERYVIRATMDGAEMDTCDSLDAVEPLRRYYEVEGVPVTVVLCREIRPGDVFLPSEARDGAVKMLAAKIAFAWRMTQVGEDFTVNCASAVMDALAALARPSGEEVGNG